MPMLHFIGCSATDADPLSPDASAGRAGVPMEVMGLMLGEFVDDYTVKVRAGQ